jgi:geranylgeranyl pyrophosphate synthase
MHALAQLWQLHHGIDAHREAVALARAQVGALIPERWRAEHPRERNPVTYAGRHFFSLLLLSAYRALDMNEDQQRWLGAINHVVRSMVTAADNLLDGEDKPVLALAFPAGAERFRSCLGLLAWSAALERVVALGVEHGSLRTEQVPGAVEDILALLIEVGAVEAEEEAGVEGIAPPDEVVQRIHEHKGGSLLGLAWVLPLLVLEGDPRLPRARMMAEGIHAIGLALQHVDDVTDLELDVASCGHNLLQSEIHHHGDEAERLHLAALRAGLDGTDYRRVCARSVGAVVARALDSAQRGFGLLEQAGYPLGSDQAMSLLAMLFEVRGEAELWRAAQAQGFAP